MPKAMTEKVANMEHRIFLRVSISLFELCKQPRSFGDDKCCSRFTAKSNVSYEPGIYVNVIVLVLVLMTATVAVVVVDKGNDGYLASITTLSHRKLERQQMMPRSKTFLRE